MITLIDCLSVALVSNSLAFSCTCLCHQSDKFRSTQTLGSTTIPEPHIQEEPSYVTFEFSNHHCRPSQSGGSMNLLVPYHKIFLSPEPTTFSFTICGRGSLLSASGKLCAVFFPVTDGTTSIARRHIDGSSCAPCTASTFLGRIFLTLSHVEVSFVHLSD